MAHTADPGWQFLRLSPEEMAKAQSKPFDSKKNVWIPDPEEGFTAGEIKGTTGDMVTVTSSKGDEKQYKKDDVHQMNPPKYEKTEDMSNLSILNEAAVLHNLRSRYGSMLIYTYSGLFCVVINPYKRLPIYTDSVCAMYKGKRPNEMPPHLFARADEAYRNMLNDRECQSMLITGESGAGKTENTKKVLAYMAIVGVSGPPPVGADGKKLPTLEEQIVMTNPVLEAYGNAKTVRNNNSSRFGKFIRTHFNNQGKLAGGDIEHYLLEKSRAIKQSPGERCYHIFYQIMTNAIAGLPAKLLLNQDVGEYNCVNQAELTINGIDDNEEMMLTDEAFDIMLWPQNEKDDIYKCTGALMHMGNMKFKQKPREEQANNEGTKECEDACVNWGCNPEDYMKAILRPRVKVGTEWVAKGQNLQQVQWSIGAMAKALYDRLFNWIVKRCNVTLDAKGLERKYFIGVLDIAGFEIFDFNSFEQLWINFVNEKLQQFFNHHMFVLEQEEYGREGIPWEVIDFGMDLAACIELIEKPMGILAMLDEECIVPKATDLTLASKLVDQHLGKHNNFVKPKPPKGKQAEAHFALAHYAGIVRYNVTAWLEKNKDPLNDTCVSVLKSTKSNQILLDCWSDYTTQEEAAAAAKKDGGGGARKKGKSAAFNTVSMKYREGLGNLMHMLHQTHPHFIRCIIPNELKKSGYIDAALVLNQLTCNGVLEGIRICRKGFPNRVLFLDFKQRYCILAPDAAKKSEDPAACSANIINNLKEGGRLGKEEAQIGTTKVFFKAGILAGLEEMRDDMIAGILTKIQSQMRWWLARGEAMKRKEQLAGLKIIQSNIQSWTQLRTWPWFSLLGQVKQLAAAGREAEKLEKMRGEYDEVVSKLTAAEKKHTEMDEGIVAMTAEIEAVRAEVAAKSGCGVEMEEKVDSLEAQKADMQAKIADLQDTLALTEGSTADAAKSKKKTEGEVESAKKALQDLEMTNRKIDSEKQSKDHQIRSQQEEMNRQDEAIAKLNKEKKHQEDIQRKLTEDLQAEEDKVNHMTKVKSKLESSVEEMEDSLEREKHVRQDIDKTKRKDEGELKVANETVDELNRIRHDLENNLKKKEKEMQTLSSRLDDDNSAVSKLQKQLKDAEGRNRELEEDMESERQSRSRADKAKSDLQSELEELSDRLDEAGGATASQAEANKKREAELGKLRRDIEESNLQHEAQMTSMRKKHNDGVAEMGEQLDSLNKLKSRLDKDKAQMQREIAELSNAFDSETKAKNSFDKACKAIEAELAEANAKAEDLSRQVGDSSSSKNRLQSDCGEHIRQLEDAEAQLNNLNRLKSQLLTQLDEAKRSADDEAREKQSALTQLRNFQHEADALRDQLDEESESKAEVTRLLSKASAETQQWRSKFENEGVARAEEIEEAKRKLSARIKELQEQLDATNVRLASVEKNRHRIQAELEDAQVEAERQSGLAQSLEKKQKGFDRVVDEWKRKSDDLGAELDASQREARNLSTEVFRLKTLLDEAGEQVGAVRRENHALSQEIKDMSDQLGEGGRSVHELQKMRRRLELEKEELQVALDEAESALESEEGKVLRAQVEVNQIRQEIEKRIHEKEEEFESTRKNQQRALDSMQASLESEAKGRAELLRIKKKLEQDINELEIALDHANRANADAQKNMKRYQEQIREIQVSIEDEQRQRDEVREQYNMAEKRCNLLQHEKEEATVNAASADRARHQAEADLGDMRETFNDVSAQQANLSALKRKSEGEMVVLHSELDEVLGHLKGADEKAKKAVMDAARMADELRAEQEHAQNIERQRVALDLQIKEMQARVDEAEAAALKGGKKTIAKLETKVREMEADLENEARRHQETNKQLRKQERVAKEMQFQVEEDKKAHERQHDLLEKMAQKINTYKKQVEDAEQLAAINLQKYRQLTHTLDDAEERADVAEGSLAKMRLKSRSSASLAPTGRSASRSRASVLEEF